MSHQGSQPERQPLSGGASSGGEAEGIGPFRGERRWVFAGMALLLILALGSALYNGGWSQGFGMGLLAGGALDGETVSPYMLYRGHGFHPFGFFGGFFRILFFVFLFAMIAKFFGFWRWKMHGGYGPHHHWHGGYGPGGYGHGGYGQGGPAQPGGPQGPYGQPQPPQGQEPTPGSSGTSSGTEDDKPKNTVWLNV